ncbi:MAG: putative PurR-regulated permease PerM [Limisphaerales bacterium]|jgi:predicted PurR-regulated permease PerM
MSEPRRISYGFMAVILLVVASMHLATPLLTVLFCMFALHLFNFRGRKFLASGLLVCLCTAILMGLTYFFNQAVLTTPLVLDQLLPVVMEAAARNEIVLPFDDVESFKSVAMDTLMQQMGLVGASLETFLRQAAMVLIGIVVAISLFANGSIVLDNEFHSSKNNLYNLTAEEIGARFRLFYKSFATVMGAQIVISSINTFVTALFIMGAKLPYASLLVVVTFLCGLLPILGNLMSNVIILSVALTVSPTTALAALIFLVVIHKMEYFLNSQIIGKRIRNPMWLTLLALVVGERLMGIAGMILAPVILHYIKSEASKVRVVKRKREGNNRSENLVEENVEQPPQPEV